jgi:hypothetical protein
MGGGRIRAEVGEEKGSKTGVCFSLGAAGEAMAESFWENCRGV